MFPVTHTLKGVVKAVNAKLVTADINPNTFLIDPTEIEKVEELKTKVIIPVVHLYGNVADMDAIMSLARRYNLQVIEDTAEALFSAYKGHPAGTIGDIGTFSFSRYKDHYDW